MAPPGAEARAVAERYRADSARGAAKCFTDSDRRVFALYGVSPEQVLTYPKHFEPRSVPELVQERISADDAGRWPSRFASGNELVHLVTAGVTPEEVMMWPTRFTGWDIAEMRLAGATAEGVQAWDPRFSAFDIGHCVTYGLEPQVAMRYPLWLTGRQMVLLHNFDVGPDRANELDPADGRTDEDLMRAIQLRWPC